MSSTRSSGAQVTGLAPSADNEAYLELPDVPEEKRTPIIKEKTVASSTGAQR